MSISWHASSAFALYILSNEWLTSMDKRLLVVYLYPSRGPSMRRFASLRRRFLSYSLTRMSRGSVSLEEEASTADHEYEPSSVFFAA